MAVVVARLRCWVEGTIGTCCRVQAKPIRHMTNNLLFNCVFFFLCFQRYYSLFVPYLKNSPFRTVENRNTYAAHASLFVPYARSFDQPLFVN